MDSAVRIPTPPPPTFASALEAHMATLSAFYSTVAPKKFVLELEAKAASAGDASEVPDIETFTRTRVSEIVQRYFYNGTDAHNNVSVVDELDRLVDDLHKIYKKRPTFAQEQRFLSTPTTSSSTPSSTPSSISLTPVPSPRPSPQKASRYDADETNKILEQKVWTMLKDVKSTIDTNVKSLNDNLNQGQVVVKGGAVSEADYSRVVKENMRLKVEVEEVKEAKRLEVERERGRVESLRVIVEAIGGEVVEAIGRDSNNDNDNDNKKESNPVAKKRVDNTDDGDSDVFEHPILASQNSLLSSLKSENDRLRDTIKAKDTELSQISILENQLQKQKSTLSSTKASHAMERERVKGLEDSLGKFEERVRVLEAEVEEGRRREGEVKGLWEGEREGRRRMEERWEEERAAVVRMVDEERAKIKIQLEEERRQIKADIEAQIGPLGISELKNLLDEISEEEQTTLTMKIMEEREERGRLGRENEHLKKEIKRAADKIVQLTREATEGYVESVKFVG
ncbi:hypothetical protein TrST_g3202 [Triparma strigata]|uniref:Uncharacterized protein n=1 Tax=Triparma strigata TaxID=1606541 RepID=A0A9W7AB35_9STRA|nr:hypothetical protein TrST_g3202 [Triparma strigata]